MADAKQSDDASTPAELTCQSCGADLPGSATVCWLCETPVDLASGQGWASRAELARATRIAAGKQAGGFSLASLMMCVTLVCVVLGVFTIAPGLGVPLGIVAFITWLRTVSVVKTRAASGAPLTTGGIVLMFVRSVAFTLLILLLVGVTAAAAFGTVCFGLISAAEPRNSEFTGLLVVSVIVLIVAIFGLVVATRTARHLWHRDHQVPKRVSDRG